MADVRSLLKAKRAEARISHPYASYTSGPTPQLKCTICQSIIKHASAWEGHLGSKAHRLNVARIRQEEEERARREHEELVRAQREQMEREQAEREEQEREHVPTKRKASDAPPDAQKKPKLKSAPTSFPADFFSDPNRQLPSLDPSSDSEDDDDNDNAQTTNDANAMAVDSTPSQPGPKTAIDEEYEAFQRAMLAEQQKDAAETFAQATIAAEAEIYTEEQISGFPGARSGADGSADAVGAAEPEPPMTEEELAEAKRKAKELEERELIMDRLLEEERLQEEADMRVAAMKSRIEALKKKREARKAEKGKGKEGKAKQKEDDDKMQT
ncbi:hypothetical protein CC1G_13460 [Coprinopsis cinerea okayama7|uniref:Uncharacterized protein n=1 Tax=Coprinopsis cinerea (strain Okayama-7 / 130 / ATCC MYA-4618 / FGSC 9003) TaxID=240176 RepID=A8P4K7_COPC7|nr:hypothetical protein CC1G_13460 [Coprinopsis cinerea okayama7\|eukprot:XP_001838766.1 hypothetical protein CC1G_13460 [Coprinopsis cinerea okayama7\